MAIKVLMMRWPTLILTLFMLFGNDMYSPEYTMQWIYEAIRKAAIKREEGQVTTCAFPSVSRLNEVKHDIDAESQAFLDDGHKETLQCECYEDYGIPSYIDK